MSNRVFVPHLVAPPPVPPVTARVERVAGQTMGTTWSVVAVLPPEVAIAAVEAAAQEELDRVVAQMSPWEPNSALCRFNRSTPGSWHPLPEDTFTVLAHALNLAAASDGAFDPTVGKLVDLWGFGPLARPPSPPDAEELAAARNPAGWRALDLDRAGRRVRQPGGLHLDLCAIAKGYGVDLVAERLGRLGLTSYLVEVGGELRGHGVKPDGTPWWVELERPPEAPAAHRTLIALHGLAVATSGTYRRAFDHGGRRYSHAIDPRTGSPVLDHPAAVTVVTASAMEADALATALMVMGAEVGAAFACSRDIAALFVTPGAAEGEEWLSPALKRMLD